MSVIVMVPREVYLQPGELWQGQGQTRVKTLLGSCVAITLWHAATQRGAICHYLLASGQSKLKQNPGYFMGGAMSFFHDTIKKWGVKPDAVEVKVFGGGNMFHDLVYRQSGMDVAARNVEEGLNSLRQQGFKVSKQDVGGVRYRTLHFDVWTGDVWVRYGPYPGSRVA
ncbi:chemotaxis protein CheD [Aliidiomarina sedimenti]|uniref:Probable chemoreceptor glutamine deamidase CheD n=1 Tax=Aliidiomarina sedimenti TaxID=1933879 RepID=A0ABY0C2A3_9GAMM|nr:chemotaxis protein CheD [Aliidiomarina sedimenti]RUO31908.1 chemotaxis protein CheD [Aliidiomarina sedimenti]